MRETSVHSSFALHWYINCSQHARIDAGCCRTYVSQGRRPQQCEPDLCRHVIAPPSTTLTVRRPKTKSNCTFVLFATPDLFAVTFRQPVRFYAHRPAQNSAAFCVVLKHFFVEHDNRRAPSRPFMPQRVTPAVRRHYVPQQPTWSGRYFSPVVGHERQHQGN